EPAQSPRAASWRQAPANVLGEAPPSSTNGAVYVAPLRPGEGAIEALHPLRDLLPVGPDTPLDATLASIGMDSMGIVGLRADLVDVPGGKDLARQLNPASRVADVLALIHAIGPVASQGPRIEEYLHHARWVDVTPASVNKRSDEHVLLSRGSLLPG